MFEFIETNGTIWSIYGVEGQAKQRWQIRPSTAQPPPLPPPHHHINVCEFLSNLATFFLSKVEETVEVSKNVGQRP